ncbi:proton-conducting transporter membrane subunit [Pseudofrankia sp. DC12]|uniref:proton-conducting transporter transmembrane domain-containing protein n=1 Tax=Pseudofrankia sp. DC12 TaxID=683315 RepID=UPI0032D5940C
MPSRALPTVAGAGIGVVGGAGVVYGVAAIGGGLAPVSVGWLVPLAGLRLAADATGGLFMVVTGAVGVAVGIYTVGYAAHGHLGRTPLSVLPLFLGCMLGVPLADSVTTFLLLWELMALSSLLLVLTEARRREVRDAGLWYAAMTHLGFVAVLIGLAVFAAAAGAQGFPELRAGAAGLSPTTRTAVFLLTVTGFGSKAGLVPLHAWLPRAHPEAPGPVSALMSAAMVNLGIYGILRVDVALLGSGPRWWGLVLLAAGAVTAVFGVLQACVATDLKRLLAYSTSENMGLICVALGTAMVLTASGGTRVAAVAMTAALVHVVGHAAFKALGFLAAGAVTTATGRRDLDALGGLAPRMPSTTAAFGVAALGASGLPLGCGFVGEWLLLQSLVHALPAGGTTVALVMPLTVGVVALTTGLGVAAMVKAFGVGFLARPRSAEAAGAREVGRPMAAGMGLAAVACGVLAVAPAVLAPTVSRVLLELPGGRGTPRPQLGVLLRLPGAGGSMSPAWLAFGVAAGMLVAFCATRWRARRRPPPRAAELWACGGGALNTRMQYTATSFAEPLQRVFDGVLRPDIELAVTPYRQAPYLVAKVAYRSRLRDALETSLYTPVIRMVAAAARIARRAHRGSIHVYLAYGAAGLIVALVVAR